MWTLVTELSVFFLIAASIGWLMGRYLCKSNEIEERNEKKKYLSQKNQLHNELTQCQEEYQASVKHLNGSEKKYVNAELQVTNLQAKLILLTKENKQLTDQLLTAKQIKIKLEDITQDYQYEQEQRHRYREKNSKLKDERDNLIDTRNTLIEKLHSTESLLQSVTFDFEASATQGKAQKQRVEQLDNEIISIKQESKTENNRLTEKLVHENDKSIQRLEQERDKEIQRLQIERDQLVYKLTADNELALNKLEATTYQAVQQLETIENNNRSQHANFKLADNENHNLKQRLEQQNKDYSLLQQKCTDLSEESLSFGRKLDRLTNEKNELRHNLEAITIENNDYLGRLRAISSVVDVVGTEPNRLISINASSS